MMHKIILLFLGLLGCVGMGVAQISQLGQCENIDLMDNFVLDSFLGTWYEVGKASTQNAECSSWIFTNNAAGFTVSNPSVVNNFLQTATGTATHTTGSAQLTLTMSSSYTPINFGILATDYNNYAIAIECVNLEDLKRRVNVWQLGRATNSYATEATLQLANTALGTIGLNVNSLQSIDHSATACTQLPVIPPGQRIILPGRCDYNNINVVPNFQVGEFVGTWYEISSYYSANALGTCARAEYTLVGSTVDVVNSQVLNQRLDTVTGTASLIGVDGRLNVLLNIQGVPVPVAQELLILDTDYDGYAVSYTCVDLPDNQRQVNSWILSRSKQITAASQTEVDRVINSYVDLNTAYYQPTAQTDDACFYYPEAVLDLPVVFPGQCDESISAINSFNMALFAGIWHEVQAYPKEQQTGTCINHEFTAVAGNANTLNLVSNQVVNQFATSASGSVSFESTDGSGKLRLNMIVNGQPIEFPYWILSTDYTSYALVYSCRDIDDDYRLVHSWKLSRTQTLEPAAVAPINTAMAAVQVLEEEYFQPIDQSAAGCAGYPEIPPDQPVILDGQCDPNINVVQNFRMADFVGTWQEISSYFSYNTYRTCTQADFRMVGSTISVVGGDVLNQELVSLTGTVSLVGTEGRMNIGWQFFGITIDQELFILDTDYTGYAVVYSCFNLGNNQKQVISRILSRSPQITAASQIEVDRVIDSYVDLNAAYFHPTVQTDEACFYYPEFQPGVPVEFFGQCDMSVPVQPNFDPTQYVGLWHDIQSYPSTFQQGTCNNAFYTLTPELTVDVFNTQVVNQRLETMSGVAIIPDLNEPAKLRVSFPIGDTGETTSTDYWIMATDYSNYSLVYSCENLPNNRRMVFSWKLSRSKTLTSDAQAVMNAVIDSIPVLDSRYYVNGVQTPTGCFYFPEAVTGQPVVFPGQCNNENINAMSAFNMAAFAGIWHEVEAYPKEQQTGTCINHEFTAVAGNANTLNLVSNQVVNQFVTSASGSVSFESTDGTGKLRLNMVVNGQPIEIPYWILNTNYISYALVYSCININDDYRSVHSWKLSRTQNLLASAVGPINNAMAAVQVLEQKYFEPIDQSAAGCFAHPNIPEGDPIILPGQCQPVSPVTGFQSGAFGGTWYEVARYASERQTGDCAASQFTATPQNTFTLTQTIVYNERQTVVSGTATLDADGSGVLTATLSDGDQLTYTTTMYILDTDYNSFALLYSCDNLPGTTNRQLYSWQLSRSQSGLTQEANDRISELIANKADLIENFYQPIGQTNSDCFYYPDFEGFPESIVLPGTCPEISGKANFEPDKYVKNWYEVARYPIESQFGTCSRAEYDLVDGVVTIRNTMVVDGKLRTQFGTASAVSDGTGVLDVTFVLDDGAEVYATYYVLETDYESFSLVYSCRNLTDETREVYSWMLSRTPELPQPAIDAIRTVIDNTEGLREDLYLQTNQTAQDCFYVPEPVPGEPVLFRGACEPVNAMINFNPTEYLGWWHEIERYPSDNVVGQCSSAEFIQTGNAIQVIQTSIDGGVHNETISTAVLSNDATITITRDEWPTVWTVLDTDYNTYSLLYACENVTTDWGVSRRVWSAKHSKSRSLSTEAKEAMNSTIADTPVLDQDLYENVNQSYSACFHYREVAGPQVILSGPCDTGIDFQADFDVARFAGRWYQHERYPYPQVSNEGTCVGTRYTVNGDNINVQNWEVLNGTLNTIDGTATANAETATLTVTLEGTAEPMNLRILITDYENYALAYTCTDIGLYRRSVGAFKLSRHRELTSESQNAINTYMQNRDEFYSSYFITVEQNADCPEPSSAFLAKSSIIVMLFCIALQLVM